jgi:hypothetical protein
MSLRRDGIFCISTRMTDNATQTSPFLVAALYHFVSLPRFESLQAPLQALCEENGVKGTLLLAHEGINGTIAGPDAGIHAVLSFLRAQPEFAALEHKESRASKMPFLRMKAKLKKEIVTMGVENIDPNKVVGTYIDPSNWNALISDPDTIVIDTRNDYETAIGIFRGAVDPKTKTFREFPDWLRRGLSPQGRHPEISGGSAAGGKSLGRGMLRLRRARFSGAWSEGRRAQALPRLPQPDHGRRGHLALLRGRRFLQQLLRYAQ